MSLEELHQTFLDESAELLCDMEEALLGLEAAPDDTDLVNRVFRAAHTIKGSAGLFGFDPIVSFTHTVETLLDRVRAGEQRLNADLIAALLACGDHIGQLVTAVVNSDQPPTELAAAGSALLARLPGGATAPAATATATPTAAAEGTPIAADTWHISLRPGPDLFRYGMEPLALLAYLETLGDLTDVTLLLDHLPEPESFDPESCYLAFELQLRSEASRAEIAGAFDFVRETSEVHILPPHGCIDDYASVIEALPEGADRIGEILVASGALTQDELERVLARQTALHETNEPARVGDLLVKGGDLQPELVEKALEKQSRNREQRQVESKHVRIAADKLDDLINLVGEMVIAGATALNLAQRSKDSALVEANAAVAHIVEQIRDRSLKLRMVQIGETFNRFHRVVHDVSRELGKDIGLAISGAETELDKSVIERIGDPLTHLIRNAIDHGIEPAARRRERGKPERGTVTLNAYHESGSIVIEVSDDGGGIDRERLLDKARGAGLVAPDQVLPEHEIYALVFEPGLSTASRVTNLSGRGVGMDVVRRNVEALRGTVEVDSAAGEGTTIRIRLPLTLAIIEGFLMRVGNAYFVAPLDMVDECIEFRNATGERKGRRLISLRGIGLPFVRLRDWFNEGGPGGKRENVIVVHYGGRRAGLVVDELLGEYQTVIKPLGGMFEHVRGVSGSTILGNGRVALILDVPALIQKVTASEEAVHALPAVRAVAS